MFAGVDSVVDFVVGPGGELSGHVELADGEPAAGQLVTLALGTPGGRTESATVTDKGGRYVFRKVTPGPKRLVVEGARTRAGAAQHVLDVAAGDLREHLDFVIPLGGRLGGMVVDGSGLPVEDARVFVLEVGADLGAALGEQRTARDGRFLFDGLPPRTVSLRVLHEQHETWARSVQAGIESLRVTLGPVPVIWGLVVDDLGGVVREFDVTVPSSRDRRRTHVEHQQGFFRVRTLRSGVHDVTVEAAGFAPATVRLHSGGQASWFPQRVLLTQE